jgi:hypothetical protein
MRSFSSMSATHSTKSPIPSEERNRRWDPRRSQRQTANPQSRNAEVHVGRHPRGIPNLLNVAAWLLFLWRGQDSNLAQALSGLSA